MERLIEIHSPLRINIKYRCFFDLRIIGKNGKVITYLMLNDRNYELFVETCMRHKIKNNIIRPNPRTRTARFKEKNGTTLK
jgi:hypothetical protein